MKKTLVFSCILIFLVFSSAFSGNLKVQDPKNTWKQGPATIDSASIIITPKGTHINYDLYLVFSAKATSYTKLTDTLEVQYYFELTKDAIVTDSWLWVEDTLVRAKLIDRWSASQIYEGIVQRRKDPSIFFKNTSTQYEFRVFPMAGSRTRKVKISWMEPIVWNSNKTNNLLPFTLLKNASSDTKIEMKILMDEEWKNPKILYDNNVFISDFVEEQDAIYGKILHKTFPIKDLSGTKSYYLTYDNPMTDGIFFKAFKEDFENGFFELSILPVKAFNLNFTKNVLFVLDYDINFTSIAYKDVLNALKDLVVNNFSPSDSFNVILNRNNLMPVSDKWIEATPEKINFYFDEISSFSPTYYSLLPQLLQNAQTFLDNNSGSYTIMNIISSSASFGKPEITNIILNDLHQTAKTIVPAYICDLADTGIRYNINGNYYTGNEYLYINLAKLTAGEFYGAWQSIKSGFTKLSTSFQPKFLDLEMRLNFDNGFAYSKYPINSSSLNTMSNYSLVGKFFGSGKFTAELTGVFKSNKLIPLNKTIEIPTYDITNKSSRTVWMGKYISYLESQTKTNSIVTDIIQTSMDNRILSLYTAFLALEPWMTGESQGNDENDGKGNTVVKEDDNVYFEASPNPFTKEVKVNISLKDLNDNVNGIEIYNSAGLLVNTIDIGSFFGSKTFYFIWTGIDRNGNQLPNGVYLIVVKTNSTTRTIKIVLNR